MGVVMTEVIVSPGVIVEHVGGELLVVVPGQTDVVKLTGDVAEVLEDIRAGKPVDLSDPTVAGLVALGIVSTPGVSRRGLIKASAIGVGAGVAVMAIPGVAAASSHEGVEGGENGEEDEDEEELPPVELGGLYLYNGVAQTLTFTVLKSDNEDAYPFTAAITQSNMPPLSITDFDPPTSVFGGADGADATFAEWQATGSVAADLDDFAGGGDLGGTFVFGGTTYDVGFNPGAVISLLVENSERVKAALPVPHNDGQDVSDPVVVSFNVEYSGNTSATGLVFSGYRETNDLRFTVDIPENSIDTIVSATVVFTFDNKRWVAVYTPSAPQ
jgi:hypothetical protein